MDDIEDELLAQRVLRSLADKGLLLVTSEASFTALAQGLSRDFDDWEDEPDKVAEWIAEQDCVVDLLGTDEDVRETIAAALSEPVANAGASKPKPARPMLSVAESESSGGKSRANGWSWNEDQTQLAINSTDLVDVIAGLREWLHRVYEVAAHNPPGDTLVCYLGDETITAVGFVDPKREFAASAESRNASLPDGVRQLDWQIHCAIPPAALCDSEVLEEDETFDVLESALGSVTKEQRDSMPIYLWDVEYAGTIRRLDAS